MEQDVTFRLHCWFADQFDDDSLVWGLTAENENFVWEIEDGVVWRVD